MHWKCFLCPFFCLFLGDLLSHLNSIHRDDTNSGNKCGLPNCNTELEYTSVHSFVKHVRASLLQSTYEGVFRTNKEETNPVRNTTGKQLLFINLNLFIYS